MQTTPSTREDLTDEVWGAALAKIMKGPEAQPSRPSMGDELDLFVPQSVASALLNAIPAFARLLYTSAYGSAKRNAYLIVRRLGMPADFFWKFDYWTQDHALEMLTKVVNRIFTTLMARQKEGALDLVGVDVERSRFQVTFRECAECAGLTANAPLCFFHAGLFAGILGALLDRELDAIEVECLGRQQGRCAFVIGRQDDKEIARFIEERFGGASVQLDLQARARASVEGVPAREWGNLVDVGYYQMMLASSLLTNLGLLTEATLTAGEELARRLAPLVFGFAPEPREAITAFYRQLRHMQLEIAPQDGTLAVTLREAPERTGVLRDAEFWPFIAGELQGLLSLALGRQVRYQESKQEGERLLLLFAP
ncbi:MAG: hypothetical protein HY688_02735 [Chloroflexi bacterium]|nr:hypothetical protein [Chloroflexota bacterium]